MDEENIHDQRQACFVVQSWRHEPDEIPGQPAVLPSGYHHDLACGLAPNVDIELRVKGNLVLVQRQFLPVERQQRLEFVQQLGERLDL